MIRFMRYVGSKFKYVNKINRFINSSNKNTYIEPFFGSGSVFFNLNKKFDKYIINDINPNLFRIYHSFKEIEFIDYINEINYIWKNFGDIKENKESYYSFRNWFNVNYWKSNSIKEGIYLHFLCNTCINSLARFGPNGFNNSYGNCFYKLDENSFNIIKNKLNNAEITSLDYKELMNEKEALYFLDPPYFQKEISYISNFNSLNLEEFLNLIKNKEFIYTDILNEYNKNLKYEVIREMENISPNRKRQKEGNFECIFYSDSLYRKDNVNYFFK